MTLMVTTAIVATLTFTAGVLVGGLITHWRWSSAGCVIAGAKTRTAFCPVVSRWHKGGKR